MKRFKKVIAALSLLVAGVGLWAQAPVNTPDATEIVRYGRIPVSYYNGLPNIEVPLYHVNVADIDLPISLSYNASGIKVNQYPTTVGLGWSLNAGGGIYRVVNGMPDETCNLDLEEETGMFYSDIHPGFFYFSKTLCPNWISRSFLANVDNNARHGIHYDTEPDEFIIKACGLSASIYFYQNEDGLQYKIRSNNGESFAVEMSVNSTDLDLKFASSILPEQQWLPARKSHRWISSFKITKTDGTVLHFGGTEAIEFYSEKRNRPNGNHFMKTIPSAWMLTKIETPSGRTVGFEYTRDGSPIVISDVKTSVLARIEGNTDQSQPFSSSDKSFCIQHPVYLSRIRIDGGMVLDFCHTMRNDCPNLCPADEQFMRSSSGFGLDATYFDDNSTYDMGSSNDCVRYAPHNYTKKLSQLSIFPAIDSLKAIEIIDFQYIENPNERLKLKKVLIKDWNNETAQTYSFRYNSQHLPQYNTPAQDIWGYYNNKNYRVADVLPHEMAEYRTPNFLFTKAEVLEEITYPTGGSLGLEYELHDYSKEATQAPDFTVVDRCGLAGGLRIKELKYLTGSKVYRHRFEYKNSDGSSSGILSGSPVYEDFGWQHVNYDFCAWFDFIYFRANADYVQDYTIISESYLNPFGMPTGNHVTYSRVLEYIDDELVKEYQYTNHDDYPDTQEHEIYTNYDGRGLTNAFTSSSLMRGLLTTEIWYCNGHIVKTVDRDYYNGLDSENYVRCVAGGLIDGCLEVPFARFTPYRVFTFCPYVTRMVEREYGVNGVPQIMERSEMYTYNSNLQQTSVSRILSDGSSETILVRYPDDFNAGVCEQLSDKKAFGLPIEVIKMRGNNIIAGTLNEYEITPEGAIVKTSENTLSITEPLTESGYQWYDGIHM